MAKKNDFDFSEFDNLFDEITKTTNEIDGIKPPPTPVMPLSNRRITTSLPFQKPNLPDTLKIDIVWDRTSMAKTYAEQSMSYEQFLEELSAAAPNFTISAYNSKTAPNSTVSAYTRKPGSTYLRLFDIRGFTFDPITAVALYKLKEHFNPCMWDYAAAALGLSDELAKWIIHSTTIGFTEECLETRRQICAAIQKNYYRKLS